jgi:hypothetical protein
MSDYRHWPRRDGARWIQSSVYVPPQWSIQFYADLKIIMMAVAETHSHAIILAVHEMAERLRERSKNEPRV